MTSCDLCGKNAVGKARIEGVTLTVCANCMVLGTAISEAPRTVSRSTNSSAYGHSYNRAQPQAPARELVLTLDFGKRLRAARQHMKLNEKDAALKLNMKESTLLHFESGSLQPDEATIRKLEKFYAIKITESI